MMYTVLPQAFLAAMFTGACVYNCMGGDRDKASAWAALAVFSFCLMLILGLRK